MQKSVNVAKKNAFISYDAKSECYLLNTKQDVAPGKPPNVRNVCMRGGGGGGGGGGGFRWGQVCSPHHAKV